MEEKELVERLENPEFIDVDPLKETYVENILEDPQHEIEIVEHHTALLCIDMQYLDAAPGEGIFADAVKSGVPAEAQEYYFTRLEQIALPNVRKLQECFRNEALEVIHVRIMSLTEDGRDRSPGHKRLGIHAAPNSREAQILEEVAPQGNELVISKTASGVFSSTNIDYILKNMGITSLFCVGVYTDECVSTTVRTASDLGYFVTLIEDACATVTPDRHNFTVSTLKDRYCRVLSTDEACELISKTVDS